MRLAPHTAQHRLGTSSPVTVPRHPTGTFPRVNIRVPELLGEPTGCGPSPCTWLSHALSTTPTPPRPRASPLRCRSPRHYCPLAFPSRWALPMCTILDCCDAREVALTRPSLPRSAAPQRAAGYTGPPAAAFSPLLELRGYGFCFTSWLQNALAALINKGGQGTTYP